MTVIKEIILENFMSYKYARVPLKPGLNIICGPNGAGKSSILLGIAVALGQSYTERSRRLGDLVRRGEDIGRVTVVLDNTPRNGSRPIPEIKSDQILISRYLRTDGTYWQEINNRTVLKGEVERILSRLHLNPDNMLIIMHQNMIDLFGAMDPSERLKLVEEAVGLRGYREKILEAREKLAHTLSEEEAVKSMLQRAHETLRHWEEEYRRLLKKRELQEQKSRLEREYAWSKFCRKEEEARDLQERIEGLKRELRELQRTLSKVSKEESELKERIERLEFDLDSAYQKLILSERKTAAAEAKMKILERLQVPQLRGELQRIREELAEGKEEKEERRTEIVRLKERLSKCRGSYVDCKVRYAISEFRRGLLEDEISSLQSDLRRVTQEMEELRLQAERVGPKITVKRRPMEILDEMKWINAQLMSLADVPEDAERMYFSYQETLRELEEKAKEAARNRERALQELEVRKQRWRNELEKLLKDVKTAYDRLLSRVDGKGDLVLSNPEDVEAAGLEILVGFRGTPPTVLDAYTQSGGERTAALMCFLLALQHHIKSPFRAVDEFEAHLDPRNREELMRGIIETCAEGDYQYVLITPGWLGELEGVSNVIVVQNIGGVSEVRTGESD